MEYKGNFYNRVFFYAADIEKVYLQEQLKTGSRVSRVYI